MAEASTPKTFAVALVVAVCCAGLIAGTAVTLADRIQANKDRERMAAILASAGLAEASDIEMRIVELESGRYVSSAEIGPGTFDQADAASDPELSVPIPVDEDLAELDRRERFAWVGVVRDGDALERLILPVRGWGYGGVMEGFVVLDGDLTTIRGIRFTEHEETPGLGGEITQASWRQGFEGKRIYDESGELQLEVVPEGANPRSALFPYQVDGISGATITSECVSALLRFWFGPWGFRPYLERLAAAHSGPGEEHGGHAAEGGPA